jgi:Domain of unknown function (DUF4159)
MGNWNASGRRRRVRRSVAAVVVTCGLAVVASLEGAQRGISSKPVKHSQIDVSSPHAAAEEGYDGGFRFCRIRFNTSPDGDGAGWFVDYPRADENLSLRLSQLTSIPVTTVGEGDPVRLVLQLTETDLFQCPFVMMTEPGGADLSQEEARQLGTYLRKGGFLWADDFWGSRAWEWWSMQIAKALPADEFPIVDVPIDHPMFHTMFDIKAIPQIPNIGLWESSHITSERGADSPQAYARAIFDKKGHLMVFMTFDTDFGDAFERETESPDYFQRFSVPAYEIGSDVLVYALTH